jgi:adenylate kinase
VKEHIEVCRVIHLVCSDEESMMHRIRRRAIRENRVDDANQSIIQHRFEVYRKQTQPVLDSYPQELIPVQNEHFSHLGRNF